MTDEIQNKSKKTCIVQLDYRQQPLTDYSNRKHYTLVYRKNFLNSLIEIKIFKKELMLIISILG